MRFFLPLLLLVSFAGAQIESPNCIVKGSSMTIQELEAEGDSLRLNKQYVNALDCYRTALKRKPLPLQQMAELHNKSGIAYLQWARYTEARKEFEKATKVNRESATAFNNLGVTHYMTGNFKKAIKAYERASTLDPSVASHHTNLGAAHFARKDYIRAGQAYEKAIAIDPGIFERKSVVGVNAHLAAPGEKGRYHFVVAKMYARRNDLERCLLHLRKAFEDGFQVADNVGNDPAFDSVRNSPAFIEIVSAHKSVLAAK